MASNVLSKTFKVLVTHADTPKVGIELLKEM